MLVIFDMIGLFVMGLVIGVIAVLLFNSLEDK